MLSFFLFLSTKVSIELKEAQLDSNHSKTVAKNIASESKGKQKKTMEELQYASQLSVEQHHQKTQITAQAKEAEKQSEIHKKRSRMNTSQSVVSLTGGGQFGNMAMMAGMASVYYFIVVLLFMYMYIYICFYFFYLRVL